MVAGCLKPKNSISMKSLRELISSYLKETFTSMMVDIPYSIGRVIEKFQTAKHLQCGKRPTKKQTAIYMMSLSVDVMLEEAAAMEKEALEGVK